MNYANGDSAEQGNVAVRIREFYDPRLQTADFADVLPVLDDKRRHPVDMTLARTEIGRAVLAIGEEDPWTLTQREVVAAEVTSLFFIRDDVQAAEAASQIGMSPEHFGRIYEQVESDTEHVADEIALGVKAILGDELRPGDPDLQLLYSQKFGMEINSNTSPVVLAGLMLAYTAHEGQTRANENREYFTHVQAAAQIYQAAWSELAKRGDTKDRAWLHRQLFVNLLHDATENQMTKDGSSYLVGNSSKITPLLMYKTLRAIGESKEDATAVVEDILLVTKSRGMQNEGMPAQEYLEDCTRTIRAMIAKFCDTVHNNIIDPKQTPDYERLKVEYNYMLDEIQNHLSGKDSFGERMLNKIYAIALLYRNNHEGFMQYACQFDFGLAA